LGVVWILVAFDADGVPPFGANDLLFFLWKREEEIKLEIREENKSARKLGVGREKANFAKF
jgi:hypothetical protein